MNSIQKNMLDKQLIIDKVYILDPINGQYDINEINKRRLNPFYSKIIQNNNKLTTTLSNKY
jgi:hypothetical protein